MLEQMWEAAKEFILKEVEFESFKKFMMYTIIDAREEVKHDHITTFDQLFEIATTKMDVTNVTLIESLIFEHRVEHCSTSTSARESTFIRASSSSTTRFCSTSLATSVLCPTPASQ